MVAVEVRWPAEVRVFQYNGLLVAVAARVGQTVETTDFDPILRRAEDSTVDAVVLIGVALFDEVL